MNDRHPSGSSTPTVHTPDASYGLYTTYEQQGAHSGYAAGYDGYSTGTFDSLSGAYGDDDPLFGALPGTYGSGSGSYDSGQYASGQYDTAQWGTGAQQTGGYDAYSSYGTYGGDAYQAASYETGGYDAGAAWAGGIPHQAGPAPVESIDTSAQDGHLGQVGHSGQWDATAWTTGSYESGQHHFAQQDFTQSDFTQQDAGQYDSTQWDAAAYAEDSYAEASYDPAPAAELEHTAVFEALEEPGDEAPAPAETPGADYPAADFSEAAAHAEVAPDEGHEGEYAGGVDADGANWNGGGVATVPVQRRPGPSSRARRRMPARRSAMLTVAVPSVAVMGVAGIAAASVSGIDSDKGGAKGAQAAHGPPAEQSAAANNKLDTQLASLTADADDFADRASRTQERIDLKQRQLEEKKRKEAEARRREALRPKYALPVEQHGLSAYYGQAGINWMSVHTGIDFPVSYGTPVMAATDGTVRTQYNLAYGNMAIVTAPDGTETWYCHLSSTKIRSGSVKAGDVIAYSGNSGNSTGPHLHFEVRPGGGSAIDPLPWLRSHGIEPT
ncbi:M23 family metallopeptidase [Streptomyces sp. 8N616]|uniref:M23 family metallopeptidase n=1 Tax=Streptomyces sp. 8N616 TaxID=3457414 RepID=UPI003FD6631F